jgi:hypothetical protein
MTLSCPPLLASREQERKILSLERRMRDGYQRKTKGVFIGREASCRYSDVCPFGPCAPTRVRHLENRASCGGYPDGQVNCPT